MKFFHLVSGKRALSPQKVPAQTSYGSRNLQVLPEGGKIVGHQSVKIASDQGSDSKMVCQPNTNPKNSISISDIEDHRGEKGQFEVQEIRLNVQSP